MPNHRPSVRRRSRLPLPGVRLCSEGWFIATIRGKFLTRWSELFPAIPGVSTKRHHDRAEACPLLGVKRTSGGRRFRFICALSASRGHADERAFHLLLDALNGAAANAALARHKELREVEIERALRLLRQGTAGLL